MNGDTVEGEAQAGMNESKRRFFSGDTLQQALVQAANHFHLKPEEVAFQPIDKRHGFTKVRRKVVIEVNPEAPKRAPGAITTSGGMPAGAARPEAAGVPSRPGTPAMPATAATTGAVKVPTLETLEMPETPEIAGAVTHAAPGSVPGSGGPSRSLGQPSAPRGEGRGGGHGGRREDGAGGRRQGNDARRGFGGERDRPRTPSGAFPRERRPSFGGADAGPEAAPEDLVALPERPRAVAERYPQAEGPQAAAAAQGVELLMRIAGLDLTPRIYRGEERLEIDLVGGDTDWCFADDGELLMAIEHLLPRIIRTLSGEAVLCRVDCDNFHEIREERLRSLAQKVADEVRQKGRARTLVPMNPADRRIVHVTLADDPAVATESEGDGYFKRITVRPV
jgi:predicted RNA-binding protein Jag